MTQTHISLDFSGSDIASQRSQAVAAFIHTARRHLPDPAKAQAEQLRAVAQALEQLGLRQDLFSQAQFSVSTDNPAQVYRLAEDLDGGFALYVSAGLPGKAQPPHDHTTWAIIAGIQGNERNVLYRRHKTDDPLQDRLELLRTVDVVPGTSVTLLPDDVHTIELQGNEPGLHLHFYGLALELLHERVVFASKEGGQLPPVCAARLDPACFDQPAGAEGGTGGW
jgi:predicted metal-dependent enzyme (double-stranded beta helix superfamily)